MMKKLCAILLAACLLPAVLSAQNPRAVIKAIYKGDSFEQVKDKHDRAVKSNPGNEPAMQLMEALYLLHNGQPVDGYYQYCGSRAEIESSNDIAKMLKSLQLRLPDLFAGGILSSHLGRFSPCRLLFIGLLFHRFPGRRSRNGVHSCLFLSGRNILNIVLFQLCRGNR